MGRTGKIAPLRYVHKTKKSTKINVRSNARSIYERLFTIFIINECRQENIQQNVFPKNCSFIYSQW